MRKIFILCVVVCFLGCSGGSPIATPEAKAKKLIKEYIRNNLGDPDSYEEIYFSALDSTYTMLPNNIYSRLRELEFNFEYRGDFYKELYQEEFDSLKKIELNFVPQLQMSQVHKYRAANNTGGRDVYVLQFYFDKDVASIEDVNLLTEEDIEMLKDVIKMYKNSDTPLSPEEQKALSKAEAIYQGLTLQTIK